MNFVRSDWSRTQNVNKRADWLTLFPLVVQDSVIEELESFIDDNYNELSLNDPEKY
jgi:hypothetical protein